MSFNTGVTVGQDNPPASLAARRGCGGTESEVGINVAVCVRRPEHFDPFWKISHRRSYHSPLIAPSSPHAARVRARIHHEARGQVVVMRRLSACSISVTGNCDGFDGSLSKAPRRYTFILYCTRYHPLCLHPDSNSFVRMDFGEAIPSLFLSVPRFRN